LHRIALPVVSEWCQLRPRIYPLIRASLARTASPAQASPRGGDDEVDEGVGQRGDRHRPGEVFAAERPEGLSPKRWVVERTLSWLGQKIVPFSEGVVPKERPAKPRKRG
jgi:hypothetical protein